MSEGKTVFVLFFRETDSTIEGEFGTPLGNCAGRSIREVVGVVIAMTRMPEILGPNGPKLGSPEDYAYFDWDGRKLELDTPIDELSGPNVVVGYRSDDLDESKASFIAQTLRETLAGDNRGLREHLLRACFGRNWSQGIPSTRMMGGALFSSHLCSTFREQAFWTWQQLAKARKLRIHLGEESLTDFNLLEIRMRHGHEVITKTFSKAQESRDGADWEWWFTGPKRNWLGFRLQAKVLDVASDRFEHLSYVTPTGEFQSTLLCRRASSHRPKLIPLYCLYSHWGGNYEDFRSAGGSHVPEAYGCALLDAHRVQRLHGTKASHSLEALLRYMTPWHELVCCDDFGGGDLPSRALNVWRQVIRGPADEVAGYDVELIGEPPNYVSLLMQNELTESPDPFLRSITVFREGEAE